jgi:hypothetical protein
MIAAVGNAFAAVLAASGVPQDPWPFVIAGYVVMALGLVGYAALTIVRGRRLSRRVPPSDRRWLDRRSLDRRWLDRRQDSA